MLSIIIPCYNDGQYLLEAVNSAKAQTYCPLEIIVVDDYSNDPSTVKLLAELDGVIVLHNKGVKGVSSARNTGIAHAAGEYILPLDADDKIDPTYAEKAVNALKKDQTLGTCYCLARHFGLKRGRWLLPHFSCDNLLFDNMIFVSAVFRKKDWQRLGGFDENIIRGMEDYAFWLKLAYSGKKVLCLPEYLFFYRVRAGSRTAGLSDVNNLNAALLDVYSSCKPIFQANAHKLLIRCHELQHMRAREHGLVSYKLLSWIFGLEWKIKTFIKRFLGRN